MVFSTLHLPSPQSPTPTYVAYSYLTTPQQIIAHTSGSVIVFTGGVSFIPIEKFFEIFHLWEMSKEFLGKMTNLLNFTCFPLMNEGGNQFGKEFFQAVAVQIYRKSQRIYGENASLSIASRS